MLDPSFGLQGRDCYSEPQTGAILFSRLCFQARLRHPSEGAGALPTLLGPVSPVGKDRGSGLSVVSCADGLVRKRKPIQGQVRTSNCFSKLKGLGHSHSLHPESGTRNKTSQEQAEGYYISCF